VAMLLDELPRTRNGKIDRLTLQRMTTEEVVK
jgi:acyl-coenzyme A synthetase/AMP-(fatty) acid ligase